MPDDNRTQGQSNDAPRDPLDDLIAPILGHDRPAESNHQPVRSSAQNESRCDPLDDLLPETQPSRSVVVGGKSLDDKMGKFRRDFNNFQFPDAANLSGADRSSHSVKSVLHWPFDQSGRAVAVNQSSKLPIGGWLAFVAAGLVIGSVVGAIRLCLEISVAMDGKLAIEYPGFNDLLIAEVLTWCALLVFQVVLAVLFFKKHHAVPKLMVCWLSMNLLGAIVLLSWSEQVFRESIDPVKFLASPVVLALIWIPYFASSKRVKRTFGDARLRPTPAKEMHPKRADNSQTGLKTDVKSVAEEIVLFTEDELHAVAQKAAIPNECRQISLDDQVTDTELLAESKPLRPRSDGVKQTEQSRVRLVILVGTLAVVVGLFIANGNESRDGSKPAGSVPPAVLRQGDGGKTKPEAIAPPQVKDAPPRTPEELFARVSPSVVRVNVRNERSKPVSFGSGFFVRDDSTVITNYHVIEWAFSAEVVLHDGTSLPVLGVQGFDAASDIAVLKVAHEPKKDIRHLTLGSNMLPPVGSKVYVIGAPEGLDSSLSDGLVSGRREHDDRLWIQISAPISPGSSGSPVLSADSSVIGVATWTRHIEGQNLNFASPASGIAGLVANKSRLQQLPDLLLAHVQILEDIYRRTIGTQQTEDGRRIASENALHQMDQLSASFRKTPLFWEYKGNIYFDQSRWDEAITAYLKVLAIDNEVPFIWRRIGDIHNVRRQYDDAVLAFGQGVKVEPNNDNAWRDFGSSLLNVNRAKEGADALRRSIAINAKNASAHTFLGDALAELGDIEGGVGEYKTALNLEPDNFFINYNYGNFLRRKGRYKDAIKAFEKARTLAGRSKEIQAMCDSELEKARTLDRLR